jgi:hypothetical protein
MYTPDMMDEKGKPVLSRAGLMTEQENALRVKGQSKHEPVQRTPNPSDDDDLTEDQVHAFRRFKKKGRAGGLVTDRAPG